MKVEDYMKLPKRRLAELLEERDRAISNPIYIPFPAPTLSCLEDFSKCTNPYHDCINCPHNNCTGGGSTTDSTFKL